MDVSITIASYNSCEVTLKTIDSIRRETSGLSYEIIVVDNASTDNSAESIASKFPEVRLIRSARNLGFAAAQNLAISASSGKYILILNSDVILVDNPIAKMLSRLRLYGGRVGATGPQILNSDGSLAPSARRKIIYSLPVVALTIINQTIPFIKLLPIRFLRKYFGSLLAGIHDNFSPPKDVQEVEWVDGMCILFKRETLENIGLFDEQYFFDFEIGDILIRVANAGWKIVFDPSVSIIHLGGYSRKRFSSIAIESQRSELIYYSKYRPGYVNPLRYLNMLRLRIEMFLLRLREFFGFCGESSKEQLDILKDTYAVLVDFAPISAKKNEKIPRLDPCSRRTGF